MVFHFRTFIPNTVGGAQAALIDPFAFPRRGKENRLRWMRGYILPHQSPSATASPLEAFWVNSPPSMTAQGDAYYRTA